MLDRALFVASVIIIFYARLLLPYLTACLSVKGSLRSDVLHLFVSNVPIVCNLYCEMHMHIAPQSETYSDYCHCAHVTYFVHKTLLICRLPPCYISL